MEHKPGLLCHASPFRPLYRRQVRRVPQLLHRQPPQRLHRRDSGSAPDRATLIYGIDREPCYIARFAPLGRRRKLDVCVVCHSGDCINCHMPLQSLQAITFQLSDIAPFSAYRMRTHRIGIYRGDSSKVLPSVGHP